MRELALRFSANLKHEEVIETDTQKEIMTK
jgi:hypothetical protein